MPATLYIADPAVNVWSSDIPAMVLDLNSIPTSGTGFGLLESPDFGGVDTEATWISQAPHPGAIQATRTHPISTMQLKLRIAKTSSVDVIVQLVEQLAALLDEGGVMVWQEHLSAQRRYIDFYSSPIPALIRGQAEAGYLLAKKLQDPEGVPLTIWRYPYLRGQAVIGAAKSLFMRPNSRHYTVNSIASAQSPARIVINSPNTAKTVQWRIGRRSRGNLTEYETKYSGEIEDTPTGEDVDTSLNQVSIPAASNSSGRLTAFTNTAMVRRWRQETVATPSAVIGQHKVFFVIRPKAGFLYNVQMRSGVADIKPVEVAGEVVPVDYTAITAGQEQFHALYMGNITVDENIEKLIIEGWARSPAGSGGEILWDHWFMIPADEEYGVMSTIGQRIGQANATRYIGSDLTLTGTGASYSEDSAKVTKQNDTAFTPLAALDDGEHEVYFHISTKDQAVAPNVKVGEAQVVNDQATVVAKVDIITGKQVWQAREPRIRFPSVTGRTYKFGIKYTRADDPDRYMFANVIEDSYLRTVSQRAVIDGWQRQQYIWNSAVETRIAPLFQEGPLFNVLSGQTDFFFDCGEYLGNLYNAVDPREPLVRSDVAADYKVRVDYIPMYLPM